MVEPEPMTALDRDALIDKARAWCLEYRGPKPAAELVAELSQASDAYVAARVTSIEKVALPGWRRDAVAADLRAAGDRAVGAARHRRIDAYQPAPRINWPDGYDRDKAIAALRAAGMYPHELDPSDTWILGALMRLIDRQYMQASWARNEAQRQEWIAASKPRTDRRSGS
jgi:hypothetical protein